MDEYLHLAIFPDVSQALATLSGKTLAILSNGSPFRLSEVVKNAGLDQVFSLIVSVDEIRIYKPSPLVYSLMRTKLGIPKESVGFVSSNYFDVAGAKSYGFQVYWVNRAFAPADSLHFSPDEEISLLTEIKI